MELRHLRYFSAVAEELHFGRAAERLRVSQPPLSAAVRDLESELGVLLFERTSRRVSLTPAGSELAARAKDILRRADDAKLDAQRAARGEVGQLAIGYATAATYALLPEVLRRFRAAHPGIRLSMQERRSEEQAEAVSNGTLDAGFVCLPVGSRGLEVHVLSEERLVVALPKRHPLAGRRSVDVRALHGQPAVQARTSLEPGWARPCELAMARAGVELAVVQEADSKLAVLALVAAGLGLAVLSESTARLRHAGVAFRPLTGLRTRLALGLVHRAKDASPALAAFVASTKPRARSGAGRR